MRSALEHIEEIVARLGAHPMLLLDFDGTLAPIVARPEDAYAPDSTLEVLNRCASLHPLAIISGRTLDDIRARVPVSRAWYAGSHGLEWEIDGEVSRKDTPDAVAEALAAARSALQQLSRSYTGIIPEEKGHCFALNYRALSDEAAQHFSAQAHAAVSPLLPSGLRVLDGMRTFEITPQIDWTKGECARMLVNTAQERFGSGFTPVYIGDSITDEDAFHALAQDGVTVRVGQSAESTAGFFLPDQTSVEGFLRQLCP